MDSIASPLKSTDIPLTILTEEFEDDEGNDLVPIQFNAPVQEVVNESSPVSGEGAKSRRNIHWPSPLYMISLFLTGTLSSIGHHLYYHSLNGKPVGNVSDQQQALRLGTTFAFISHTCLATSVGFAYTQWLWRSLKRTKMSISSLDAAFSARSNILSLLNKDMLLKLTVGSILVLISWCLPLPSLITPATISISPNIVIRYTSAKVPVLDISSPGQSHLFAYSVPVNGTNSTDNDSELFLEPRTNINRLALATASIGAILPNTAPAVNSSYSIHFSGPVVKCSEANSFIANVTDLVHNISASQEANVEVYNTYFAFVPDLSDFRSGATAPEIANKSLIMKNGLQRPVNGSNELWMRFQRYSYASSGQKILEPYYLQCQLYNASYIVTLSFQDGNQNVSDISMQLGNTVEYPVVNISAPSNLVQHSYAAFMWAFNDQLIGSMGFYNNTANDSAPLLSEINSKIQVTSLLGSSDLDAFFDKNDAIYGNANSTPSGQRLADIQFARNRTLDVLIEELSYNTTLSFLSSSLLSPPQNTNLTTTKFMNVYFYHSFYLLLPYGLAITFTLGANLLGIYAYLHNGACHCNDFSSILTSTDGLARSICNTKPGQRRQSLGQLPLQRDVSRVELLLRDLPEGGVKFKRVDDLMD